MMNRIRYVVGILAIVIAGCSGDNELERGTRLYNKGEYREAIDMYTEYLQLNPSNTNALYNRGRAYEELDMQEDAIADFFKVIEITENHVAANISIAMDLYYRQKEYRKAVKYLDNALEADPSNAKAFTLKGKCYQRIGEFEKAMEFFDNAVAVEADYAEAWYARGGLYLSMDKTGQACSDFLKASNLGLEAAQDIYDKYCE